MLEVPPGTIVVSELAQRPQRPGDRGRRARLVRAERPTRRSPAPTSPTRSRNSTNSTSRTSPSTSPTTASRPSRRSPARSPSAAPPRRSARAGEQAAEETSGHFAVVLDNEVKTRPIINFAENPDGIDGRTGAQISGGFTSITDAQDLATFLQIGALPINLKLISQIRGLGDARRTGARPGPAAPASSACSSWSSS